MIHELCEHTDWLLLITYTLIILDIKIDLNYFFFDKFPCGLLWVDLNVFIWLISGRYTVWLLRALWESIACCITDFKNGIKSGHSMQQWRANPRPNMKAPEEQKEISKLRKEVRLFNHQWNKT